MLTSHRSLLAVSLVTLFACTVEKGDDTGASNTDPDTESAGSAESTAGEAGNTTDASPTTGINGGTDTGSEDTTAGETGEVDGNTPCIDTPTVLAGDEASALGFSGDELLAGKLGEKTAMLLFASEPTTLNDDIKGLSLPLTFTLRHEGGEIRFIDSEVNPDYDDSGNESGFPGECTDRIEVDVLIDFVTDGGEFDEHREAVLTATTVERADVQVKLLPPGLMGSFDPATIYNPAEDPAWVVTQIQIGAFWDGALSGGSLLNEVIVGGDDGFAGFGPIASWGDQQP